MAGYYNTQLNLAVPTRSLASGMGEGVLAGSERLAEALKGIKRGELEDAAREQARRAYETELGFKQRAEQRQIDEIQNRVAKEQATNEAVMLSMDPSAYVSGKIGAERAAMMDSIKGLSPQEQAKIIGQYDASASGNEWKNVVLGNRNVDQGEVVAAETSRLNRALKDPTSREFKALQDAEWNATKRAADYKHGLDMAKYNRQREEANRVLDTESKYIAGMLPEGNKFAQVLKDPNASALDKKVALEYGKNELSNLTKFAEEQNKLAKGKEAKTFTAEKKVEEDIYSAIPKVANPKEFAKLFEDFKSMGGTPQEFQRLVTNVMWDKPEKSTEGVMTDWGRVDPDISGVLRFMELAKEKMNKGAKVDTKEILKKVEEVKDKRTGDWREDPILDNISISW